MLSNASYDAFSQKYLSGSILLLLLFFFFFLISKNIYIYIYILKEPHENIGQPKSTERDTNIEKSKRENNNTNGVNKN